MEITKTLQRIYNKLSTLEDYLSSFGEKYKEFINKEELYEDMIKDDNEKLEEETVLDFLNLIFDEVFI